MSCRIIYICPAACITVARNCLWNTLCTLYLHRGRGSSLPSLGRHLHGVQGRCDQATVHPPSLRGKPSDDPSVWCSSRFSQQWWARPAKLRVRAPWALSWLVLPHRCTSSSSPFEGRAQRWEAYDTVDSFPSPAPREVARLGFGWKPSWLGTAPKLWGPCRYNLLMLNQL